MCFCPYRRTAILHFLAASAPHPARAVARAALVVLAVAWAAPASGQVVDSVMLANGNVLHGETKELQRGKLAFDTDAMDVVEIDWEDAAFLWSDLFFEVTVAEGLFYYGQLSSTGTERELVVTLFEESVTLDFDSVIQLRNLAESFWGRTTGYVDIGTTITRASDLRSALLKGRVTYSGRIWELAVAGEAYYQSQKTAAGATERTRRSSTSVSGTRFLNGLWAATTSLRLESNDQLSLDLRSLIALGGRYNIIRNQGIEFYTGLSAVFNRERFSGQDGVGSTEGKLTLNFDMFDVGDLDFSVLFEGFKTLDSRRYRTNLDVRAVWEIVKDFKVGLTAAESFDSAPQEGAQKRDFQYGFTLGWSWD